MESKVISPKDVFEIIDKNGDNEDLVSLIRDQFEVHGLPPNSQDSSGMTLLMQAAWKNNLPLVQFLLTQGADPNSENDEGHGFSTLHFAALKGSPDVCFALLEAGANPSRVNRVKRTAAQMAAFVGRHECVSIINNFVPKETVYYFTRKQPLEKEAKLHYTLAKHIHKLVLNMNIHPVNLGLFVKKNKELLDNLPKVTQILESMSAREFQNRNDVNEVLALKFHMIHYILKDAQQQMEKTGQPIDKWLKMMLVGREEDGFPVFQEIFLRKGVAMFPFPESQLFKILMTNFHHCKVIGQGLSAAEYINQGFNGQKGFKDHENCTTCGENGAEKKCSACKSVEYCNAECQKLHWFVHKKFCVKSKDKQTTSSS
ncbi:ankyrin repeat and MYND domain-containing protein 2 [Lepeophtheirus salmonis]|uniref:Ankyrin repeat and MYND domaincontaining protein 2like [Saccoglossus kowalevskii] n=1 Tax=Lepeophtheirus salmonis TaxID=72036 RepID=A0A0K2UAX9_LEPSM|nr:ankyrin repeat and MYND domain-containing protein 2-like [Lepeophtheirus salmonis]